MHQSPFRPRFVPRTKEREKQEMVEEISRKLVQVKNEKDRRNLAETLWDVAEAAKQAGVADTVLGERIDEINRAFEKPRGPISVLLKAHVYTLAEEAHRYWDLAHQESPDQLRDQIVDAWANDPQAIEKEQRHFGHRYRDAMSHRAGGSGYVPGGIIGIRRRRELASAE